VSFKEADLAARKIDVQPVDFAFCCNVAMSDDVDRNHRIIHNVLSALNKGGVAVFVLPSMESVTHSAMSLINWYQKEGVGMSEIPSDEFNHFISRTPKQVHEGIVNIDNVPTKHYLFTELYALFNTEKYSMQLLDRLEYGWDTEFESPPRWMQAPYPWDWVVEVKRIK